MAKDVVCPVCETSDIAVIMMESDFLISPISKKSGSDFEPEEDFDKDDVQSKDFYFHLGETQPIEIFRCNNRRCRKLFTKEEYFFKLKDVTEELLGEFIKDQAWRGKNGMAGVHESYARLLGED